MIQPEVIQFVLSAHFASSLLFCGVLFALRAATLRWVRSSPIIHTHLKGKAIGHVKSIFIIAFMIGMLYIWGEQAQSLIISFFVLMSACAWAARDMISCIGGSALRVRSHTFEIGDRIEMGSVRGDVIDTNWLTTTVLERGGRKATFSNTAFLNSVVYNENLIEGFCFETITVRIERKENWKLAYQLLMDIATEQAAPFIDAARRRLAAVEKKRGIELPAPDPKTWIDMDEPLVFTLHVRLLIPVAMVARVRAATIHTFLDRFYPICSVSELLERKIPNSSS